MYDYMKALQERFDKKPPERLVRAVQSAREEVREGMDDEKRKKLLRLLRRQRRWQLRIQPDQRQMGSAL